MSEIILVNRDGKHNKYWRGKIEREANLQWRYEANWGRIGAPSGSSKIERNLNQYGAEQTLYNKVYEKKRKGYRVIDEEEYERLCIAARIVGLQSKAEWQFVKFVNGWKPATEDELINPNIKPGIKINFTTKDSTHIMIIVDGGVVDNLNNPISPSDARYELYQKASQAIAKSI